MVSIIGAVKSLPTQIYLAGEVRELDRLAIEEGQIPGYTLMFRAGQVAFDTIRRHWPGAHRLLVLCGAGNNAGDGYIVARMAREAGLDVSVVALFDPARLHGDAALAFASYRESGGETIEWTVDLPASADLIVDAILGTGLTRPLEGAAVSVVDVVNDAAAPVLAVDVPTGLNADTGWIMGAAIQADVTVTFVGLKLGLYLASGPASCGQIVFDSLGIPPEFYARLPNAAMRIDDALLSRVLPQRRRDAHKGRFGHVLVVGGGPGMPGAARLAGEGALRVGAGRVTVATAPENVAAVVSGRPELMCRGIGDPADLGPLLAQSNVVAIGPGLGTDDWATGLVRVVEASGKPVVADADALNVVAVDPYPRENWVYTPHPGEAGRMLGGNGVHVQDNRCRALADLIKRYGGVFVLKGAGTLVGRAGDVPWVCDRGNPGMAAPGMGDVLTGIIAGVAAQGATLFDAARAGVLAHSVAGDLAAQEGQRGLMATDLCAYLRKAIN